MPARLRLRRPSRRARPSRSRRKWRGSPRACRPRRRAGVDGAHQASLSYSFRPGHSQRRRAARRGLSVSAASDCAWRRSVPRSTASKRTPRSANQCAQRVALARAELAELVVVGGAEAGLAVAHEVEGSHGARLSRRARRAAAVAAGDRCGYARAHAAAPALPRPLPPQPAASRRPRWRCWPRCSSSPPAAWSTSWRPARWRATCSATRCCSSPPSSAPTCSRWAWARGSAAIVERQLVAQFLRIELLVGLVGGLMPAALFVAHSSLPAGSGGAVPRAAVRAGGAGGRAGGAGDPAGDAHPQAPVQRSATR